MLALLALACAAGIQDVTGLEFTSADGAWILAVHGKLQADFARFQAAPGLARAAGPFRDGSETRRSRLDLRGRAAGTVGWRASADFKSDSGAELRDAYLEAKLGTGGAVLRAGHFRQPFGLENRTSSSTFSFFERSVGNELAPGRDAGLMQHGGWGGGRGTWAAGAFQETHSDAFGVDSGDRRDRSLTACLTWLPLDQDDGARLVQLGASFRHLAPDPAGVSFAERAEAHLGPKIVAASFPAADRAEQLGLEAAAVLGPASLQAEWYRTGLAGGTGPTPVLGGGYLQGAWLLTGEHREWKRGDGVPGRIRPASPLAPAAGGTGAWELAARWSWLDLGPGPGRRVGVASLVLGWHWTAHLKLQLGWLHGAAAPAGAADTVMLRLHLDW
ncbi:MAG: hypothetical protein D6702_05485 [Planctomycetota bacterium]|nr:MAG: hypothetical protein D6702_05485 [Planctomycetota bacterium]